MKLNIAYPANGTQKVIEIDDDTKLRSFYDRRISAEVDGSCLGEDYQGYIFRISGGNDLQGFPMKQGVMTNTRVRLLLREGLSCYRPRRRGERKRKSVRGCIVSAELSVLNLIVVKKGEADIPGLTDVTKPKRLGYKRAGKIRKFFALEKEDDVCKYVIRREIKPEGKKAYTKAPKVQRLVTPQRLQRKRRWKAVKRARYEKSERTAKAYKKMLDERQKVLKEKRAAKRASRRSTTA